MKKALALILTMLMLASVFAGCAAAPAAAPAEAQAPAAEPETAEAPAEAPAEEAHEPVTLTVWYYDDPGVDVTYNAWADAIKAKYPWISLAFEVLPYDAGPEKFTVACATGTTPDIYIDGYSRIAPPVNAGLAVDMTDVISEHKDAFLSEQQDGLVDGKYYYVAKATGAAYCVLANLDLAEKLGVKDMLPADFESWTYEDYLNICRKAKEADPSIIPAALFAGSKSSDAWYYTWFLANGSKITNDALTATAFNSDENRAKSLETLNFFKTLVDEKLVPDGCAVLTDEEVDALWCADKLLFEYGAFSNMTYFNTLQQEGSCVPFNYDAYAVPTAAGKAGPSACWGSYGFIGFDNNGHAEDIKRAIGVWLEDPALTGSYSTVTGRLPLLANVTVDWPTEHIATTMARAIAFGAEHNTSAFGILEPWWTDFRNTFYPQMQDFYTGKIDAETALNNWQATADPVIAAAQ